MAIWYLTPTWFNGYDAILELIFAIAAFLLAIFALKIFKITSERSTKLFSAGFMLIGVAYLAQSILNFFALHELSEPIPLIAKLSQALTLGITAAYLHIILMTCGLIVLLYMAFNVKEKKILAALLTIGVLPLFLDTNIVQTYQIISTICLIFISWYFVKNYSKKKHLLRLLTAAGFSLLLISSVIFFFAVENQLLYVAGHITELAAYFLLLVNFYLVLKK